MGTLYLPIEKIAKEKSISKIYILKYELNNAIKILEDIKLLYQDKRFSKKIDNYQNNPQIYNILNNLLNSEYLDLRELDLYYKSKFARNLINTYTDYERQKILLSLKKDKSILENIRSTDLDQIGNELYFMKYQDMINFMTINEKNINEKDFKDIINNFFNIFEFKQLKDKNSNIKTYDRGIAYYNTTILKQYPFEKVYKKMF